MSTITENINKILEVKQDLNSVLLENGIEGGAVLEEYPDKFRELFRVLEGYSEEAVDKYTNDYIDTSFVATPQITYFENVVTITCATEGAVIYYQVVSASGENDRGYGPYINKFYIKEDVWVEAYAKLNEVESAKTSLDIPFYKGDIPDNPVITRDGTTVTITCTGTYTSIWWNTVEGNYIEYTEPVTVLRTQDVWAYSTYNRFASDLVFDPAPEEAVVPEIPVIDCFRNVITITCETENADIYYNIAGTLEWILYDEPIEMAGPMGDWYRTKSILNGVESESSEYVWCPYRSAPDIPVMTFDDNRLTIVSPTSGASIWYRPYEDGDWLLYIEPIIIGPDNEGLYEAKCFLEGFESETQTCLCEYEEPVYDIPEDPEIVCSNNTVIITCPTPGAVIYYSFDNDEYNAYEGPFVIDETVTVYAYSIKNGENSNVVSLQCVYVEPVTPGEDDVPEKPDIIYNNGIIVITCPTPGATIYYKKDTELEYHIYTDPVTITETTTFMAYAFLNGYNSAVRIKTCEVDAPAVEIPAIPTIESRDNYIYMDCETDGADIYWMLIGENVWYLYTNPFRFYDDGYYKAYSYKDGQTSAERLYFAEYDGTVEYPDIPTGMVDDYGTVTLSCTTEGATIYYRPMNGGGGWAEYNGPFSIVQSTAFEMYSIKNGIDSGVVYWLAEFEGEGGDQPAVNVPEPIMDCYNNELTITCEDNRAVIYYMERGGSEWLEYDEPIEITYSGYWLSYARIGNNISNTVQIYCVYQAAFDPNEGVIITMDHGGMIKIVSKNFDDTFTNTSISVDYNLNYNGWTNTTGYNQITFTLDEGDTIQFRNGVSGVSGDQHNLMIQSSQNARFKVSGDASGFRRTLDGNSPYVYNDLPNYHMAWMFKDCYGLTDASELIISRGNEIIEDAQCWAMFYGCTNLTAAPELPATRLKPECYRSMFTSCTSLDTSPELPAVTLESRCYEGMFYGCSSLNEVFCLARTNLQEGTSTYPYTDIWMWGVAATGTFYQDPLAEWPIGPSGIPSGWVSSSNNTITDYSDLQSITATGSDWNEGQYYFWRYRIDFTLKDGYTYPNSGGGHTIQYPKFRVYNNTTHKYLKPKYLTEYVNGITRTYKFQIINNWDEEYDGWWNIDVMDQAFRDGISGIDFDILMKNRYFQLDYYNTTNTDPVFDYTVECKFIYRDVTYTKKLRMKGNLNYPIIV